MPEPNTENLSQGHRLVSGLFQIRDRVLAVEPIQQSACNIIPA